MYLALWKKEVSEVRNAQETLAPGRAHPTLILALFLGLGLIVASPNARAQTAAPRFEVTNYTIDAELFPSTHLLKAKARIDFVPKADLSSVNFELHSSLKVKGVVDGAGKNLNYRQEGLNLDVDFLNPLPAAKASSVIIDYGGTLASADGSPVENLKLAYV